MNYTKKYMNNLKTLFHIIILFFIIKESYSLKCYKCYRLEECPLRNCTFIINFIDDSYRENFLIDPTETLRICPAKEDKDGWRKLLVDGQCKMNKWLKHKQVCTVTHFDIFGESLQKIHLFGVFLGCPKQPKFTEDLVDSSRKCYLKNSRLKRYRNPNIRTPYSEYTDLTLLQKFCNVNCRGVPDKCTVCTSDGCIYPNNTQIIKFNRIPSIWEIFGKRISIGKVIIITGFIIVIIYLCATFCSNEQLPRLFNEDFHI